MKRSIAPQSLSSDERARFYQRKSVPPPVNRADKPKIPSKPTSSIQKGRPSLEPDEPATNDRVSPFSTPPSSEGSPNREEAGNKLSVGRVQTGAPRTTQAEGYFPPPQLHHTIKEGRREPVKGYSEGLTSADRQGKWSTGAVNPIDDLSEQRPGLPPRPRFDESSKEHADSTVRMMETNSADRKASTTRQRYPQRNPSLNNVVHSSLEFLPPPKRSIPSNTPATVLSESKTPPQASALPVPRASSVYGSSVPFFGVDRTRSTHDSDGSVHEMESNTASLMDYPEASQANRRPPCFTDGIREIETNYETKLFDICGQHVCTTGFLTRAWDVFSGEMVMSLSHGEKEIKVTALAFKPGATVEEEGLRLWLGTNYGDLQEVDLSVQNIVQTRSNAHSRREIVRIYRHRNTMWTLDEEGKLYVWLPDDLGLPSLASSPISHRVPKGHTFSIVIKELLWVATGRDIRIFRPGSREDTNFHVTQHPLHQLNAGEVTSGAVISSQLDRVYFGHTDGKVTIYSTQDYTCIGIINVSVYKINCLAGAGSYLWAGYNTGMIYIYDTQSEPWTVKKDWHAHANPVANILADRSSVWRFGRLQVASIGMDNVIRIWDGMLEKDWLGI